MTCFAYVVNKALYIGFRVAGFNGALVVTAFPMVSRILVLLSTLLFVAACTWLSLPHARGTAWLRAHRQLRHLEPLWRALYQATPAIALTHPASAPLDRLDPRDLNVRRYRRVIEIRDGILALHPFAADQLHECARDAVAEAGVETAEAARLADAVALEVARRAKLRGVLPAQSSPLVVGGGEDLEDEVAILEQLSLTYARRARKVAEVAEGAETRQALRAGDQQ